MSIQNASHSRPNFMFAKQSKSQQLHLHKLSDIVEVSDLVCTTILADDTTFRKKSACQYDYHYYHHYYCCYYHGSASRPEPLHTLLQSLSARHLVHGLEGVRGPGFRRHRGTLGNIDTSASAGSLLAPRVGAGWQTGGVGVGVTAALVCTTNNR